MEEKKPAAAAPSLKPDLQETPAKDAKAKADKRKAEAGKTRDARWE